MTPQFPTTSRSVEVHEDVVERVVPVISCIIPVSLPLVTGCGAQRVPNGDESVMYPQPVHYVP